MRRAKPDAVGLIPRPCVMCSGVALPPSSPPLFQRSKKEVEERLLAFWLPPPAKTHHPGFFWPLKLSRPSSLLLKWYFLPANLLLHFYFPLGGEEKNSPFLS